MTIVGSTRKVKNYSSLIVLGLSACGALAVACGSDDDSGTVSYAGSGNASAGRSGAGAAGKASAGAGNDGRAGAGAGDAVAGENAGGDAGTPGAAGAAAAGEGGAAGGDQGQAGAPPLAQFAVEQTNLVADQDNVAVTTDPRLLNAWAIAINPTAQVFWLSANHGGSAPVYGADGSIKPIDPTVPPASGDDPGSPTGQVFNSGANFMADKFIVDTEDGQIMGWAAGTVFTQRAHSDTAIYKGLALVGAGANQQLLAANFHDARIDIFDANYAAVANPDAFKDPSIPNTYAPFNVVSIADKVYVTYAEQDADKEDDVAGAGQGYVSVFDGAGTLLKSWLAGGKLNAPWAVSPAPAGFGVPATALLVGNFGDGSINAFDTISGEYLGSLTDKSGSPLVIVGLWDLKVGPTGTTDLSNTLFFSAGGDFEAHGLFGKLEATGLE